MKKLLAGFAILLILLCAGAYIFFPQKLKVSTVTYVKVSLDGAFRYLSGDHHWATNRSTSKNDTTNFGNCNKFRFAISEVKYNTLHLSVLKKGSESPLYTKMVFLELPTDSILIQWKTDYDAGFNPLRRMLQYFEAVSLKKCMDSIMEKVKLQLEQIPLVYGFDIKYTTIVDSSVVTSYTTYRSSPSTEQIYSEIQKLKDYIRTQKARETNYPMLNIIPNKDSSYVLMVGIPIDRELKGNNKVFLKRLVQIPDKTLTTTVTGGPAKVEAGFRAIEAFMNDQQLSAPVFPFQLLITDRRNETDSSKWRTQIFYPIR